MTMHLVYGLIDPRTNELRYVGKSSSGLFRPSRHATAAGRKGHTHNKAWLRQLWEDGGLVPSVLVLRECDTEADALAGEAELICRFRGLGFNLTNLTDGGEGTCGCVISEETRGRLREAAKRRWESEEYRAHVVTSLRGFVQSPETRKRMSEAKLGKPRVFSPEHRAKLGAALRGRKWSDETKAKVAEARRANKAAKLAALKEER